MAQVEPEVLQRIQADLGYGRLRFREGNSRPEWGSKAGGIWILRINAMAEQFDFIEHILPYSIVKRKKLKEAREWLYAKAQMEVGRQHLLNG